MRLVQRLFGRKILEIQADGLIQGAPVWVEFVVKILTNIGITYGLYCLTAMPLVYCAFLGSIVAYALLVLHKIVYRKYDPKTPLSLVVGDAITDCTLASVAFVAACIKLFAPLGWLMLVVDYALFRIFVQYASPGDR